MGFGLEKNNNMDFFTRHPEAKKVLKAGDRYFLVHAEDKANEYARSIGKKVQTINKPKNKK